MTERVVNQLLVEIAGLEERKEVFVIGATNRIDIIDEAMLRPGRLDKQLYVGLPSVHGRLCILKTLTRGRPLSDAIDLAEIAERGECEGLSGADLCGLVKEASMIALQEVLQKRMEGKDKQCDDDVVIEMRHFEKALGGVKPSVREKAYRRKG